LCQDLKAFLALPTTTNICESTHRNYYRFLQVKHLPLVVAAFQCFKYCQHQMRDIKAVATGLRPLLSRDKSQLQKARGKLAVLNSRMDDYDGGVRAPTHTSEHQLVPARRKPQAVAAADRSSQQTGPSRNGSTSMTEEQRLAKLHDGIRTGGLPANSIVQVRNDETNDDW
jgi:hypothetical protein